MDTAGKVIIGALAGVAIGFIIYGATKKKPVIGKTGVPTISDIDGLIQSANDGGSDIFQGLGVDKMSQVREWIRTRLTKLEVQTLTEGFKKKERDMNPEEKKKMIALLEKMLGKKIKA